MTKVARSVSPVLHSPPGRFRASRASEEHNDNKAGYVAHPEQILISSVVQTGDIDTPQRAGIRAEHFHSYGPVWEWLEEYATRYRHAPSKSAFRHAFPDFTLLKARDVEFGTEAVVQHHKRNELKRAMQSALSHLKRDEIDETLDALEPVVLKLRQDFEVDSRMEATGTDLAALVSDIEERVTRTDERGLPGVPTGFTTLDQVAGGFQPGWYCTVAARLKNGKSWAMTKMATTAALEGYSVLFHSLEMSRYQCTIRAHSFLGRALGYDIQSMALQMGKGVDLDEYRSFVDALPEKVPGQLHFIDQSRGGVTPRTIAANMERHSPDIVFVDHIQLMKTPNSNDKDYVALGEVSGALQQLAQESQIPIVIASQINRDGESGSRPPSTSNLSRADAIGQDSDMIVTMRQHTKSTVQMLLADFRHGPSGRLWWNHFDPNHGVFEEVSYEDAMDAQTEDEIEQEEL